MRARTLEAEAPSEYSIGVNSPEVTILALRLEPTQQLVGSSAEYLKPNNKQGENTAQPIGKQAA